MAEKPGEGADDSHVQMWKVKQLIRKLKAARGNGTSMISLIIPPRDQISRVQKMLGDEFGTASNIKSRVTRQSVLAAITSTQQKLKTYTRVPPNGLVVYCGMITTGRSCSETALLVTWNWCTQTLSSKQFLLCEPQRIHTAWSNQRLISVTFRPPTPSWRNPYLSVNVCRGWKTKESQHRFWTVRCSFLIGTRRALVSPHLLRFRRYKPINTSLYLCDNKFHTEALDELLRDDETFGFIVMDGVCVVVEYMDICPPALSVSRPLCCFRR